jgi:putative tricarboxylic transport membrane protein
MAWLSRISALVLLAFSVSIFLLSVRLGIGRLHSPGPGFMPSLASAVLFFLSLFVFLSHTRRPMKDQEEGHLAGWKGLAKPMGLVAALIGYAFVLNVMGYLISAFLLMFMLFLMAEPQKWRKDVVIAAIVAVLSFLVFNQWLGVRLPTGIFPQFGG